MWNNFKYFNNVKDAIYSELLLLLKNATKKKNKTKKKYS